MTTTVTITDRNRHVLHHDIETIRAQTFLLLEDIDSGTFDADEVISRLSLVISKAKQVDRKVKVQRRKAAKVVLPDETIAVWTDTFEAQAMTLDFSDPEDRAAFRGRIAYCLRVASWDIAKGLATHFGADKVGGSRDQSIRLAADAYMARFEGVTI